jgi:hypothetical protein
MNIIEETYVHNRFVICMCIMYIIQVVKFLTTEMVFRVIYSVSKYNKNNTIMNSMDT